MVSTMVVEDDPTIAEVVAYHLSKAGHDVTTVNDGQSAIDGLRSAPFNLVILDLMLPRLSGIDVLRLLRRDSAIPVIVISARDQDADQVAALELGADDYITKPFSVRQLMARVQAVLRRSFPVAMGDGPESLEAAALTIDVDRHEVRKQDEVLRLTPKEFELLVHLARNPDRVCSRDALLNAVWGYAYEGDTRTVDVHVHSLRRKIEDDPSKPTRILTIRQYGYRFVLRSAYGEAAVAFVTT